LAVGPPRPRTAHDVREQRRSAPARIAVRGELCEFRCAADRPPRDHALGDTPQRHDRVDHRAGRPCDTTGFVLINTVRPAPSVSIMGIKVALPDIISATTSSWDCVDGRRGIAAARCDMPHELIGAVRPSASIHDHAAVGGDGIGTRFVMMRARLAARSSIISGHDTRRPRIPDSSTGANDDGTWQPCLGAGGRGDRGRDHRASSTMARRCAP
jgi:hypothetical protein